jgi:hypothetical protein
MHATSKIPDRIPKSGNSMCITTSIRLAGCTTVSEHRTLILKKFR